MPLQSLYERLEAAPLVRELVEWSRNREAKDAPQSLHISGAAGSLPAFFITALRRESERPVICLQADADAAAYLHSDLEQVGGLSSEVLLLPPTGHKPYDEEQMDDPAPLMERAGTLQQLAEAQAGLLVTSVDALVEKVPPGDEVRRETLMLSVGDEHSPEEVADRLMARGFSRVEFAEEPGDMAVRGGILDVFPFAGDYPLRIEFFGDEIDSIREFNPATQRSVSRRSSAQIVPPLERRGKRGLASIFEYFPDEALFVTVDEEHLLERGRELFENAERLYAGLAEKSDDSGGAPSAEQLESHGDDDPGAPIPSDGNMPLPGELYLAPDELAASLDGRQRLLFGSFTGGRAEGTRSFDARPQPDFNSSINLLRETLKSHREEHVDTYILCDSGGQRDRLRELLLEKPAVESHAAGNGAALPEEERYYADIEHVHLQVESLHEGFVVPSLQIAAFTDHQIFNRYHRPTARKRKQVHGGLTLRQLKDLHPGDFVVHVDYGIGKFAGLRNIKVRGKQQEAVRVLFRDEDVLYVNVNALYKLYKYSGKEGHKPRLTKLGTGQWEKTKKSTKKKVKTIARDLIKLYAKRKASDGTPYSEDTIWQREMEASFQFEDTPDQAAASMAVKKDMEEPVPMDRLVCGDVGFGKTEVAIRAAFKAVQDGKQVAVLVPTTILAQQHYQTFSERLKNYPVQIEMLSRFRTRAQQKETIERMTAGTADIVVGTHRLASKDIGFKDLGLLILDEEQRFGVKVKERLRKLRVDVDTLTLTATPIPRTLQFSLLGARDLSIISTPPPNRQPIVTEIHTFDRNLIRDAIMHETSRGGQVFFIHNRVRSIDEISELLRALVPDVRIRTAHGQMKGSELEDVMMDFTEKKFDVLVSTSIIENGLDIANANTMIINRAERFGLSELHQLRGRVGRSQRKAFCYLLVPSIHSLTREAKQRLQAVEEFSELGSGFNIAMRDLDIRGAGSLLGRQQSGFIADVGYETYQRILAEAVQELRSDEFGDVFEDVPPPPAEETQIDVEEDAYIPQYYVSNKLERLNIYRRVSETRKIESLSEIRSELSDRFGPLPDEAENLILAAEVKLMGQALRLSKILFKNERLFLYLPGEKDDPHFYEEAFHPLLERLNGLDRRYALKEGKSVRAIVQEVPNLLVAKEIMDRLAEEREAAPVV